MPSQIKRRATYNDVIIAEKFCNGRLPCCHVYLSLVEDEDRLNHRTS